MRPFSGVAPVAGLLVRIFGNANSSVLPFADAGLEIFGAGGGVAGFVVDVDACLVTVGCGAASVFLSRGVAVGEALDGLAVGAEAAAGPATGGGPFGAPLGVLACAGALGGLAFATGAAGATAGAAGGMVFLSTCSVGLFVFSLLPAFLLGVEGSGGGGLATVDFVLGAGLLSAVLPLAFEFRLLFDGWAAGFFDG